MFPRLSPLSDAPKIPESRLALSGEAKTIGARAGSKGRDLLRTECNTDMGLISLPATILWTSTKRQTALLLRALGLDHTISSYCVCIPFSFFGSESSRSVTVDFCLFSVSWVSRLVHFLCSRSTLSSSVPFPPHTHSITNMGFSLLQSVFLLASARQALASCAHGTFLSPRAEDGSVKVNTFGYAGEIVSTYARTCPVQKSTD